MLLIRVSTYSRLMRGSVWYYKLFFYVVEVCISNAHILENKSLIRITRNGLQFRISLIDELTQQQGFWRDARSPQTPIPQIRFKQNHFHHLVSHNTRSNANFTNNVWVQSSAVQYVECEFVKSHVFKGTTP